MRDITAGMLGLRGYWRRGLAAVSVVAAVLLVLGQPVPSLAGGQPLATATASAGPFNKVWTFALSPYAQASQTGRSLTQLSDGAIVVGGNDAYQPNYCFKPSHPFRGGAWLVAVTSGGGNVSVTAADKCELRNIELTALLQP